jgi:hypothetical protein
MLSLQRFSLPLQKGAIYQINLRQILYTYDKINDRLRQRRSIAAKQKDNR